jgi:hypothetical protein
LRHFPNAWVVGWNEMVMTHNCINNYLEQEDGPEDLKRAG